MHTVELVERAIKLAEQLGIDVRQEWLDGPGGCCQIKGRAVLFVNLAQSPAEQLETVAQAIRKVPQAAVLPMPRDLRRALELRAA